MSSKTTAVRGIAPSRAFTRSVTGCCRALNVPLTDRSAFSLPRCASVSGAGGVQGVASVGRRKDGSGTELRADAVSGLDLVGRCGIALARGFAHDDVYVGGMILGRETR